MARTAVTVFLCTGKDCARVWRKAGVGGTPRKWLKQRLKEAGLPFKLHVVETACMDRCEQAANLCFVRGRCASFETELRPAHDADRVLAALRACVERSLDETPAETHGEPGA